MRSTVKIARMFFGLLALASGGAEALAQSVDVTTTLEIREGSRVTKLEDLDFGKIIPGPSGGTIVIAPTGAVSTTGDVTAVEGASVAEFNMTRRVFRDYPVYLAPLTSDSIEIALTTNPAIKMRVSEFTTNFNRRGVFGLPAYYFLQSYNFNVGATLTVPPNQTPGTYVGTFRVSIDYP